MNTVTQTETDTALRTRALESLLIEKGLITTEIIDEVVEKYEKDVGPLNGARVVARAWTDPDYKRRLIEDGRAAIAELGFDSAQGAKIVVLENTPRCPPPRRLHSLLLLSLVRTRLAPELVQILRVPLASRARAKSRLAENLTSTCPTP